MLEYISTFDNLLVSMMTHIAFFQVFVFFIHIAVVRWWSDMYCGIKRFHDDHHRPQNRREVRPGFLIQNWEGGAGAGFPVINSGDLASLLNKHLEQYGSEYLLECMEQGFSIKRACMTSVS